MREFEKYEMYKTKCPVCGSKNKVHTELINQRGKFVGYSLKCCGCGNYNQFLLDYETNGKKGYYPYINGKQTCIQPSFCPKKDCPLYNKCNCKDDDIKKDDKYENLDDGELSYIEFLHSPRFL